MRFFGATPDDFFGDISEFDEAMRAEQEEHDEEDRGEQQQEQPSELEASLEQILNAGNADDKITVSRRMLSRLQLSVEQSVAELNEALDAKEAAEEAQKKAEDAVTEAKAEVMRITAQFQTFKRRQQEETLRLEAAAREEVYTSLLSVVDNFERALGAAEEDESKDFDNLKEGTGLILRQLLDLMTKEGVEEVDCLGKPFDPVSCEAMMALPSDEAEPETVLQVFEKGYKMGDKVLRPAKVAVAKPADE
ncbi:MAG: nucleotide exchange factor GrpE [Abditibacteriota bacterium]|nr:nucleotide exchange factor GrpE [Abditibacteriota bacterium]MBP5092561.1 nucleotide exchange factor GrpE [Abditibacteriota bacterium]